jgi:ribosomal protein S18 acetylase RimI-like enzyme
MITFRPATPEDIPLLQKLAHTIWPHAFLTIITRAQMDLMLSKMYDPETILTEMQNGVAWYVVMENGIPIGYLSCSMVSPSECKLHKIYVLPGMHGRGIGRACLEEATRYAREKGAKILFLRVNRANDKALRAYRAFGFREAESVDWEFSPGFILHDYRMELDLTKSKGNPTPQTG